ncbi:transposase [Luteimonas sp. WGS1318]|uniref:REP-associated tyrosine transposase n=1 Tax=Luteimonas sp. WGS1318 TaxID=3366815 RepID=UPI00372D6354
MPGPPTSPGHRALRRGRVSLPQQAYLVTVTTPRRRALFAHFAAGRAVCSAFSASADEGDAALLAWVLMPDHVHWLLQLGTDASLARVIAKWKAAATRAVHAQTAHTGEVWSRGFHDRALRHDEDLRAAARYVVLNPVRAGLVARVTEYPFWDAVWLNDDGRGF